MGIVYAIQNSRVIETKKFSGFIRLCEIAYKEEGFLAQKWVNRHMGCKIFDLKHGSFHLVSGQMRIGVVLEVKVTNTIVKGVFSSREISPPMNNLFLSSQNHHYYAIHPQL